MSHSRDRFNPGRRRILHSLMAVPFVPLATTAVAAKRGINSADKVRKTQLQYDLPIVFGHDPGEDHPHGRPKTMLDFRTGGTPWHILINPQGQVIFNGFSLNTDAAIA